MEASINGQTATVELLLGAGADTEAKAGVRERMRESESHTHMWLSRWFEGGSTMWSLFTSLELRLVPHIAWGLA